MNYPCSLFRNFAVISVREDTANFRNIRFKACLTEFWVIHSSAPISVLVSPRATKFLSLRGDARSGGAG